MTSHWIETFLEAMQAERDASDNTIMAYARDLQEFEAFLTKSKRDFQSAERTDVEAYIVALENRGMASSTRARRLSAARQLFRFAFEEGWRDDDPSAQIVRVELRRRDDDPIRLDDLLHQSEQLGQQVLLVALPSRFHLVVDVPCRLEDHLLESKDLTERFQVDLG